MTSSLLQSTKLFFRSACTLPSLGTLSLRTFATIDTTSSSSSSQGLEQFRDPVSRDKRFTELVGRSWSVKELRRKNFDDLHKLWYVLYKERNMLLTEAYISNRNGSYFPQPERRQKVKKSMAAIKVVLGERKRDKIAQHALKMARMMDETKGVLLDEPESRLSDKLLEAPMATETEDNKPIISNQTSDTVPDNPENSISAILAVGFTAPYQSINKAQDPGRDVLL